MSAGIYDFTVFSEEIYRVVLGILSWTRLCVQGVWLPGKAAIQGCNPVHANLRVSCTEHTVLTSGGGQNILCIVNFRICQISVESASNVNIFQYALVVRTYYMGGKS